jgi:hypothetical protein
MPILMRLVNSAADLLVGSAVPVNSEVFSGSPLSPAEPFALAFAGFETKVICASI